MSQADSSNSTTASELYGLVSEIEGPLHDMREYAHILWLMGGGLDGTDDTGALHCLYRDMAGKAERLIEGWNALHGFALKLRHAADEQMDRSSDATDPTMIAPPIRSPLKGSELEVQIDEPLNALQAYVAILRTLALDSDMHVETTGKGLSRLAHDMSDRLKRIDQLVYGRDQAA
jgi:hypothetical protein